MTDQTRIPLKHPTKPTPPPADGPPAAPRSPGGTCARRAATASTGRARLRQRRRHRPLRCLRDQAPGRAPPVPTTADRIQEAALDSGTRALDLETDLAHVTRQRDEALEARDVLRADRDRLRAELDTANQVATFRQGVIDQMHHDIARQIALLASDPRCSATGSPPASPCRSATPSCSRRSPRRLAEPTSPTSGDTTPAASSPRSPPATCPPADGAAAARTTSAPTPG
ncbi:hypothetical protein NKG94_34600 [Micromonospora sp. M12]